MCELCREPLSGMPRRDFLRTVSTTAAGLSLSAGAAARAGAPASPAPMRKKALVRGAFIYPPSAQLHKEGYYSWPGSSFDAEGRQKAYSHRIRAMASELDMEIAMETGHLDTEEQVNRFIAEVKATKPDGLLLIPFKKGHWPHVVRIVDETGVPSVVLATLGVLLVPHVRQLHRKPGVMMISAQDDLDAVQQGMKMIRTGHWMANSLIANITGSEVVEKTVAKIGTRVRTVPHERFYSAFAEIPANSDVKALADQYWKGAKDIVEPNKEDVLDAAKTYFVLKDILGDEKADAVMMNCLPGLRRPHKHVPPCMGFMSLRDEGVAMGCESDLDATLTMMLLQSLFERPGFQHNPTVNTEKNHYVCAHCTSASRMAGVDAEPEPYILRSHAEAGWGCVPRVLFKPGQEVTIAKYLSSRDGETPQMLVYSGTMVGCPPIPPTGGCRTNAETTINELEDVCDLKGHHLCMIYGNHAEELRRFCQLYGINAVA